MKHRQINVTHRQTPRQESEELGCQLMSLVVARIAVELLTRLSHDWLPLQVTPKARKRDHYFKLISNTNFDALDVFAVFIILLIVIVVSFIYQKISELIMFPDQLF